MAHSTEEQLVAYALDDVEAGTRAAVEAHVEACAQCRMSLEEIRATLDHAAALEIPERGDDYGAQVWTSIESRLSESRSSEGSHPSTSARLPVRLMPWLAAAAAVVLVIGAYWLGRHNTGTSGAPQAPLTAQVPSSPPRGTDAIRERVVLAALGEHLDRTERTLVELVNSQPGGRVDISAERAWARDLLEANRLYRQAAGGATTPALSQVLEDLEPVLLEIANSPSRLTSDEFETLRDRIEARSLVFKVRVTGADVRARQRALMRRGESQS
ncbi:MAG: zf-HC2 domain-containing protein [Vicinamibacteria bacterium]|nr:zf-HC2 domain-containing protein [Vicinamibacteria bacterium]